MGKLMKEWDKFKDARNFAVFFTVLYIVWLFFMNFWGVFGFEETLGFMICLAGYLLMPALCIFYWIICIGMYFSVKSIEISKTSNKLWYLWEIISIIAMLGFGTATIYCLDDFMDFYSGYWRLMGDLLHCVGIKLGIIAGCLFGLIGSIMARKQLCIMGNIRRRIIIITTGIVFAVILRGCFVLQDKYTYNEKEDVWFKSMIEHYEKYGSGPDAEPFLWN